MARDKQCALGAPTRWVGAETGYGDSETEAEDTGSEAGRENTGSETGTGDTGSEARDRRL